jgi:hypothetical protein
MGNAFFVFLVWGLLCSMVKGFCFLLAGRTGIIKIWNAVLRFVRKIKAYGERLFCFFSLGLALFWGKRLLFALFKSKGGFALFCSLGDGIAVKC